MTSTKSTLRDVLIAPVVTEKSYAQIDDNRYAFRVHPDANKTEIRQAVESIFKVRVTDVNIVNMPPKPKRRGIYRGTRPGWKKAIVRLAPGHSISLLEGVG